MPRGTRISRRGFVEVRPALVRPIVGTEGGAPADARYFQASSATGTQDPGNLALTQDLASTGMALTGTQSILIDDPGIYRFTYSISFVPAGGDGDSANLTAELLESAVIIPGSTAKGGAFFQPGPNGAEWGTVANSVLYELDATGPFTVVLLAAIEGTTVKGPVRTALNGAQ